MNAFGFILWLISSKIRYGLLYICLLLIGIDFLCALILKVDDLRLKTLTDNSGRKFLLPNYENVNWAKVHFEEFVKIPSEYKSYIGWRRTYFDGETIKIDSAGIRRTVYDEFANDSLRVVFLGGSTIWGTGVNDSNTIPSIYSKITKMQGVNFGETGYSTFQSYLFLQLSILKGFKPNMVISYDGVNNSPAFLSKYFANSDEELIQKAITDGENCMKNKNYLFRNIFDVYNLLIFRFNAFDNEALDQKKFTATENERAATELLESWLLIKNLCDNLGVNFVCILQPNAYYSNPNIQNITEYLDDPNNEDFHFKNAYKYYDDVISMLNNQRYKGLKNHFINLTKSLDSVPNVYIDHCHLSPNGNEIVVGHIIRNNRRIGNHKSS